MSGSIIELSGGNQRAPAEGVAEGIENNRCKYREGALRGSAHEEQNRLSGRFCAEHFEHWIIAVTLQFS
jgi:hypothetical protein